ncbi:MAG: RNA 2',3'-cyclic phosphodiesterase [Alphaproteobacteria bacterium]|jgi:2'-5' RNA ligase|nr:RNA 2',3'-cyclic phosphodiesterase [Alphaproteobacteria bacterium]
MIRLFVALTLPENVRQGLSFLCGGVPGARWQRPDQMHLTLRFIGEIDEGTAGDVVEALEGVTMDPFPLALQGVGAFGEKRRSHVLWAGVRPEPELLRLQGKIETALIRVGLEPERRKYQPHVTLARLGQTSEAKVVDFLSANGGFASPPFMVEGFTLYSSFRGHGGAIYRPEETFALGGYDFSDEDDGYDEYEQDEHGPYADAQAPFWADAG